MISSKVSNYGFTSGVVGLENMLKKSPPLSTMSNTVVLRSDPKEDIEQPSAPEIPDLGCMITTRFKLRSMAVEVIASESERAGKDERQAVSQVVLGSEEHFHALSSTVDGLSNRIRRLETTTGDGKDTPKIDKLKAKMNRYQEELDFLIRYCDMQDANYPEDYDSDQSEEKQVRKSIYITPQNFKEMQRLKNIKHGYHHLWPHPRQYFVGKILHRQSGLLSVQWRELFIDLIYVGAFSKAGMVKH